VRDPFSPGIGSTVPGGARESELILRAALRLFLERGFDDVTVAEVADAADVSVTTVFDHFPSKEALVFDEEAEREVQLLGAVRERLATSVASPGRSPRTPACPRTTRGPARSRTSSSRRSRWTRPPPPRRWTPRSRCSGTVGRL
jgi:AcrR family transcriptional regulator